MPSAATTRPCASRYRVPSARNPSSWHATVPRARTLSSGHSGNGCRPSPTPRSATACCTPCGDCRARPWSRTVPTSWINPTMRWPWRRPACWPATRTTRCPSRSACGYACWLVTMTPSRHRSMPGMQRPGSTNWPDHTVRWRGSGSRLSPPARSNCWRRTWRDSRRKDRTGLARLPPRRHDAHQPGRSARRGPGQPTGPGIGGGTATVRGTIRA